MIERETPVNVAIVVLSDIHFDSSDKNPVLDRADQIAGAVSSENVSLHGLTVILSGDIANNGASADFEIANAFIARLREAFNRRYPGLHINLLAVPGNHDCELPKEGTDHRKKQVEASIETLLTANPSKFFIDDLLRAQNNYWEFAKQTAYNPIDTYGKLCGTATIEFGEIKLQFNLYNSAVVSQREEAPGGIYLPTSLIQGRISLPESDTLSISVVHHPLQWMEPNNMLQFRHSLLRTSDLILTGHQHFSASFRQDHDTGEQVRLFESPPLYDRKEKIPSAFRVMTIDITGKKQKDCVFEWRENLYRPKNSTYEWKPLELNRGIRQYFELSPEFLPRLSDPGVVYIHPDRPRIGLSDLFVYPDLRPSSKNGPSKLLRGAETPNRLAEAGIHLLRGDPFSGKTALAKAVFADGFVKNRFIPVLLEGNNLAIRDVAALEGLIIQALKEQYSRPDVDAYRQLLPSQRMIIIDNWHLVSVKPAERIAVYEWLKCFAQSSILFTDRLYELKQIVSGSSFLDADIDPEELLVTKFEIVGLSHVGRGDLIHRWLSLRKEAGVDPPQVSKESKTIEDEISHLLGQDRLPSYAFFIICLLQAKENRAIDTIAGGSFGHLYEVLVTSALNKAGRGGTPLDRQYALLSEIAAYLWTNNTTWISREEIQVVVDRYAEQFSIELQTNLLLREFEEARVLRRSGDQYSFHYSHFFFYFVARYIRDRIDERDDTTLHDSIDSMIDNISSLMNSTIIMFLIYFAKEKRRIIDRLVANASRIYGDVSPANLDDEAPHYALARSGEENPEAVMPLVTEADDIALTRMQERERLDASEPQYLLRTDDPYSYAADLPDLKKIHLADRNLDALGQVIRNFSATLPSATKIEVLKCAYLLGLRMMRRLMDLLEIIEGVTAVLFEAQRKAEEGSLSKADLQEIGQLLRRLRLTTQKLVALYCLKKISGSVGVADMERAYKTVMAEVPATSAMKLVDVTIRMDHFGSFPVQRILQLDRQFADKRFPRDVLHWVVATYLAMFRVDRTTRQRLASMLQKGSLPINEAVILRLSERHGGKGRT